MSIASHTIGKTDVAVNDFLKQKRQEAELTQQQLAERAGVSVSLIKQYERAGGSQPTIEKAAALADILKFDPNDLFREALEPGSITKKGSDNDAGQPVENVGYNQVKRIIDLVEARGIGARFLPSLVSEVDQELVQQPLSHTELVEIAFRHNLDIQAFIDAHENTDADIDAREFCDAIQDSIIAEAVFGLNLSEWSLEQLRALHRALAEILEKDFPLEGVPARSVFGDFFRDDDANEVFRRELAMTLPHFLIQAAVERKAPQIAKAAAEIE